jgi:pyruvate dehydrogenase E2 component (dihydrolipoamide acetyltransferase)
MGYVVRMPKLGLEMENGTLLEWFLEEGETAEEGAVVAEIESEKTTAEVDAREGGVLRRTFLEAGETVDPGTPIGIIAGADEDIEGLLAEVESELGDVAGGEESDTTSEPAGESTETPEASTSGTASETTGSSGASDSAAKASPRAEKRADELDVDLTGVEGTGPQGAITAEDVEASADATSGDEASGDAGGGDVRATPRARKRAEDLGVDLAAVSGSGPQGAITEEDVEAHAESADEGAEAQADDGPGATRTLREERAFDGMRRTIAKRLSESYREAVHVTEHREVDAESLLAAADAAEEALDADVSMTDVLLLALSDALDEHPAFNATFEDDTHRLYEEHNVCLAVDVEQGLVTPVVPDVGSKSLSALATDRREIVQRTLEGDYTMADLQGGTFTVTNLGVLGVESFDPIINPPQIGILGVNALLERVVLDDDGTPETRRVLPLDLSFDHRVVDGADAARFLGTLAENIEDPWDLLPEEVAAAREGGEDRSPEATAESAPREATARSMEGMSGTVSTQGTEQRYGDGSEPSPVDLFLGSLAACLSLSIRYQAEMRDVGVGDIDVETDARPESGSVESIDITVRLDAPEADESTLERVVEYGERSCHVAELLREDLPVELTWERR